MSAEHISPEPTNSAQRPECLTIKFANGMTLRAFGAVEIDMPPLPDISVGIKADKGDVFSADKVRELLVPALDGCREP